MLLSVVVRFCDLTGKPLRYNVNIMIINPAIFQKGVPTTFFVLTSYMNLSLIISAKLNSTDILSGVKT